MFLIVGLGNPGKKYEKTWHNAGFLAVESLAKNNNFPNFRIFKKCRAEISENFLGKEKVILAKPQTFMNNSGVSVKLLLKNWRMEPNSLMVVHDDIDLPLGKIRISKSKGTAGHKGIESIMNNLGTKDFIRIRVGIQPSNGKPKNLENFVLKRIKGEGSSKGMLDKVNKTVEMILEGKEKEAMAEYNK